MLGIFLVSAFAALVLGSTPNGTYAPGYTQCPANFTLRSSADGSLSPNETAWLQVRRANIAQALTSYLSLANLTDFNATQYLVNITANASYIPTSGMAISGGGYVSFLTGLGAYQAMDARFPAAVDAKTGGLAQCLTYITGLSGGSVAVSALAGNNFPTVEGLFAQVNTLESPFIGPNSSNVANYYTDIFEEVGSKAEMGFNVSLADVLGIIFSQNYQVGSNDTISRTWSDIQGYSNFTNGTAPMPILVVTEVLRTPNSTEEFLGSIYLPFPNATFFEYNPFEWGAWQGPEAFIPTQFLGTTMFNGSAINETCVEGFDSLSFAVGSSSNAWNGWLLESESNNTLGLFAKRSLSDESHSLVKRQGPSYGANAQNLELIQVFESTFNLSLNDSLYAVYPNPFQGYGNTSTANQSTLEIVDGSESGQTVPIWPLIQPDRDVDLIIAFDASGETPYGWQNGTNIIDTANQAAAAGLPFPKIPTAETFIANQYNILPTFFGCYEDDVPLVLYLSNSPWSAYTNYSYIQSEFYPSQLDIIFNNSFAQLTYNNSFSDPEWPACLACALIHGSVKKMGLNDTAQCQGCFSRHCWNGANTNLTDSDLLPFAPGLLLEPGLDWTTWNSTVFGAFPPATYT